MKADWDDAPVHLRTKKPSPWRLIAIASIGTLLTFGALALMDFGIVIDASKLKDAFQVRMAGMPPPPRPQPAPAEIAAQDEVQVPIATTSHPSYQETRPPAPQERNAQGKQVVFNDSNYIPKPAANTYQHSLEAPKSVARPTKRQEEQRTTRSARWEWENGYEKKRIRGSFEWVEVDGEIDLSSICQNYKQGSFIYRDCRKGAKVALSSMCNSYKPACYAGRNMMP